MYNATPRAFPVCSQLHVIAQLTKTLPGNVVPLLLPEAINQVL